MEEVQEKIFSLIDKAIYDFNLLKPNAKILVGASGGKDSTLLLKYFSNRLKRKNADFSITALYVKTDFAEDFNPELKELLQSWGIEVKTIYVNTLERVKEGFKMNCWWCSTQRRKELLSYAIENGFDAIALGHHLDDILETFLMNMLRKGEMTTMRPNFQYDKYPINIIRPLAYVPVDMIIDLAVQENWQRITCTCNFQENSDRKSARKKLEILTNGDNMTKRRIFDALKTENKLGEYRSWRKK